MSEGKLKTAVLGLGDKGRLLLKVASQIDYFNIQAVADKDTKLAERFAEEYECAAYDDYRQLVIQNQFDCLLVAAGLYSCAEHIRAAIRKKFNILKLVPLARNFEEAAELVRLSEDAEVKFAVANPGRFARSFLALREFVQQGRPEPISLVTAICTVCGEPYPAWQADPKLAGGGVLLHDCYEIIDQIVWNFAIPEQVYALNTRAAGDKQQRQYLTEDTTLVAMKFTDTFVGNLIGSRWIGIGPEKKILKAYSKNKILTATDTRFSVSDCRGQTEQELDCGDDEVHGMTELLANFGLSILSPDKNVLCSSGRENLENMAVIESAYLSARTGFPEEPGRILRMARLEPTDMRAGPK